MKGDRGNERGESTARVVSDQRIAGRISCKTVGIKQLEEMWKKARKRKRETKGKPTILSRSARMRRDGESMTEGKGGEGSLPKRRSPQRV